LAPGDVDHVNAHAASTPAGDLAEAKAIKLVLGEERGSSIPVTSLKGAFGHAMAAAGALESVMAVLTMFEGKLPPTRNHTSPDPEVGLNIVTQAKEAAIRVMTKHSFGLGGQNAALVLKAWDPASA
jgi:3-oxoacyl-[acyl-carrier-protein] synthase II